MSETVSFIYTPQQQRSIASLFQLLQRSHQFCIHQSIADPRCTSVTGPRASGCLQNCQNFPNFSTRRLQCKSRYMLWQICSPHTRDQATISPAFNSFRYLVAYSVNFIVPYSTTEIRIHNADIKFRRHFIKILRFLAIFYAALQTLKQPNHSPRLNIHLKCIYDSLWDNRNNVVLHLRFLLSLYETSERFSTKHRT